MITLLMTGRLGSYRPPLPDQPEDKEDASYSELVPVLTSCWVPVPNDRPPLAVIRKQIMGMRNV